MQDKNEIMIQALAQDIGQIQQHLQMQQIMIMQIIEALAAAQIITLEEPEQAAEEEKAESKIITP